MKAERKGLVSRVRFFATPWTVARQAPLSMGFSSQDYWDGFPFPSPGNLPDSGIKPRSPALQADSLLFEPPGKSYMHKYAFVKMYIYIHKYTNIRIRKYVFV